MHYDFAELDINVPTNASVAALEKNMQRESHTITYKIWPGIDHNFGEIYWALYGIYPKGYIEDMGNWARDIVDKKQ